MSSCYFDFECRLSCNGSINPIDSVHLCVFGTNYHSMMWRCSLHLLPLLWMVKIDETIDALKWGNWDTSARSSIPIVFGWIVLFTTIHFNPQMQMLDPFDLFVCFVLFYFFSMSYITTDRVCSCAMGHNNIFGYAN